MNEVRCASVAGATISLGATHGWASRSDFALFSARVRPRLSCVCSILLVNPAAEYEADSAAEQTDMVWHGFLPDARPNQLYGYRARACDPRWSHRRFQQNKIVMDPYARRSGVRDRWADEMFGVRGCTRTKDLFDRRDNAAFAPLAAVIDRRFTGRRSAAAHAVAQHGHLRDACMIFALRHPSVPEALQGTTSQTLTRGGNDQYLKNWASPPSN